MESAGLLKLLWANPAMSWKNRCLFLKPRRATISAGRRPRFLWCRAYLEHHLGYYAHPLKVFYYGPMFRYEQPQAGRWRQFRQWGFEILADNHSVYDAQIIFVIHRFLDLLKIKDINFRINTIGCCVCRPTYRKKLLEYYRPLKKNFCEDCQRRLRPTFRILDCKNENCQALRSSAPVILNHLCQSCNSHFQEVLGFIEGNDLRLFPTLDGCAVWTIITARFLKIEVPGLKRRRRRRAL